MILDLPKIHTALEVLQNRELHKQAPDLYSLAEVGLVWCDCQTAAIMVFRKDVEFTQWTCSSCIRK